MHPQPLFNEKELLRGIAEGNEQSFRLIYDHYRERIFNYANRLMESETAAEEIMQEVFIKVWLHRKELEELHKFSFWLYRVARNTMFDAFRKSERQRVLLTQIDRGPVSIEDADTWLLDKENQVWLNDALDLLTPTQKKVYILSRQQGKKTDEIAAELNISVNTAKKHLANSLLSLRTYLEKHNQVLAIIMAEYIMAQSF